MISLKNKEARFCENCKHQIWVTIQGPHTVERLPHCGNAIMKGPSGFDTTHCTAARKDPDRCGEIGRYWEPK